MAHYLKDIYRLYKLGSSTGGSYISIDKSLFVNINGEKIWIIGAKNNETSKIRIDVFKSRNQDDMKTFIYNHIRENITITTDRWSAYNFLDDSNYNHEVHIHGPHWNFGFRLHSTSLIEGILGTLKNKITKIYNCIPADNFILFLREAEFRYNLSKLDDDKKEKTIIDVFEYLYNTANFDFYDLEELIDNNDYDI